MTFTPETSPNLLDHRYPRETLGFLLGDGLGSVHEPTKFTPPPPVNYAPDHPWDSDVLVGANAVQQPTNGDLYPFGHTLPVVSGSFPTLLSSIFSPGSQPIPWILGSLFQLVPTIISSTLPAPDEPPRLDPVNEGRTDKGKGKARGACSDYIDQPGSELAPTEDEVFADALREAAAASRSVGSRVRSPDGAGPSGSSTSTRTSDIVASLSSPTLPPKSHPESGSDSEQAEIDHAIRISSIEHIENALHTLQANFTFPARLDLHLPSDTESCASNPIYGDTKRYIAAYLPITSANSTIFNFSRDLRQLVCQLDLIDSQNDMEAEAMKEKVAGAINRVLEDVESEVEEVIGKWMSLQATGVDVVGR